MMSPLMCFSELISRLAGGGAVNGSSRPSRRAIGASVTPCVSADRSTTKKTTSKITSAPGTPIMSGNVASVIGTAPLSPTQETMASSRRSKLNGVAGRSTATGRATSISASATSTPSHPTAMRRRGTPRGPRVAHPGDDGRLAPVEIERRERETYRDRPGGEHQRQRAQQAGPPRRHETAGEAEQPQHHEHDDLAEPGTGIVKEQDAALEH